MKDRRFGPPPDLSRISTWTPEKEAIQATIIQESVCREEERQANLPIKSLEAAISLKLTLTIENAKAAQQLKMSLTEMLQKREEDSFYFHRVAETAFRERISWFEAEAKLEHVETQGHFFIDEVDKHRNRGSWAKATPPHPEGMRNSKGIYDNRHKE